MYKTAETGNSSKGNEWEMVIFEAIPEDGECWRRDYVYGADCSRGEYQPPGKHIIDDSGKRCMSDH